MYYLDNDEARKKIAQQGADRANSLVQTHEFWLGIDTSLGVAGLTR